MAENPRSRIERKVDQRDVHRFTPGIDVVARPVDTYDPGANLSSGATRLANALGGVAALGRQAGQVLELQNQAAEKEGAKKFALGEATPDKKEGISAYLSTANVVRGVMHRSQGAKDSVTAQGELSEAAMKATSMEEFQQAAKDISTKYAGGFQDSPEYLTSFNSVFHEAKTSHEIALNKKFWVQGQKKALEGHTVQATQLFKDQLVGLMTTEGTIDPEALAVEAGGIAQRLREDLSARQAELEKLGLTKSEISEWYLRALGSVAVSNGAPELLDFADVPDSVGGQKLSNLLNDVVEGFRSQATTARQRMATLAKQKAREAQEITTENVMRDYSVIMNEWVQWQTSPEFSMTSPKTQEFTQRMQSLMTSQEAISMSGWDPQKHEVLRNTFSTIHLLKLNGTPQQSAEVDLMIAKGDISGLERIVASPDQYGAKLVAKAAGVVTDNTEKVTANQKSAHRNVVLTRGLRIRDTLTRNLGQDVFETYYRKGSGGSTGSLESQRAAYQADPAVVRHVDLLKYHYDQGLSAKIDELYSETLLAKGEVTLEDAKDIHNKALEMVEDEVKPIRDFLQAQAEARGREEKAKEAERKMKEAMENTPAIQPDFDTGISVNPIKTISDSLFNLYSTLRQKGGFSLETEQDLKLFTQEVERFNKTATPKEKSIGDLLKEMIRVGGTITQDDIDDYLNSVIQQKKQNDPGLGTINPD